MRTLLLNIVITHMILLLFVYSTAKVTLFCASYLHRCFFLMFIITLDEVKG